MSAHVSGTSTLASGLRCVREWAALLSASLKSSVHDVTSPVCFHDVPYHKLLAERSLHHSCRHLSALWCAAIDPQALLISRVGDLLVTEARSTSRYFRGPCYSGGSSAGLASPMRPLATPLTTTTGLRISQALPHDSSLAQYYIYDSLGASTSSTIWVRSRQCRRSRGRRKYYPVPLRRAHRCRGQACIHVSRSLLNMCSPPYRKVAPCGTSELRSCPGVAIKHVRLEGMIRWPTFGPAWPSLANVWPDLANMWQERPRVAYVGQHVVALGSQLPKIEQGRPVSVKAGHLLVKCGPCQILTNFDEFWPIFGRISAPFAISRQLFRNLFGNL